MDDRQRQIRSAIRAFLLIATTEERERELQISIDNGDDFRAECIRELMTEDAEWEAHHTGD